MDAVRMDLTQYRLKVEDILRSPGPAPTGATQSVEPFEQVLQGSMKRVNELHQGADRLVQKLSLGDVEDVSEVSIAVEKAELALRTLVEVRNKLVDAYQQIARMPV